MRVSIMPGPAEFFVFVSDGNRLFINVPGMQHLIYIAKTRAHRDLNHHQAVAGNDAGEILKGLSEEISTEEPINKVMMRTAMSQGHRQLKRRD